MPGPYALDVRTLQHPAHAAGWPRRLVYGCICTGLEERARCSPAGREVGYPCEAGTLCGPLSRASKESAMQREARCRWSTTSCTPRDCVQSGTRAWRVKRSHGTHVRGALRSKFSWHAHRSPGKVEASRRPCTSVRQQRHRLCCSIESWSQPSEAVKARSAVLAASAQLQGSTEVPNVKRAAAHCHLVVVGGHVDSSGASGWR